MYVATINRDTTLQTPQGARQNMYDLNSTDHCGCCKRLVNCKIHSNTRQQWHILERYGDNTCYCCLRTNLRNEVHQSRHKETRRIRQITLITVIQLYVISAARLPLPTLPHVSKSQRTPPVTYPCFHKS